MAPSAVQGDETSKGGSFVFFRGPGASAARQVFVSMDESVASLRQELMASAPYAQQCGLKTGARYLHDDARTLSSYGVSSGATVDAMMSLMGGAGEAEMTAAPPAEKTKIFGRRITHAAPAQPAAAGGGLAVEQSVYFQQQARGLTTESSLAQGGFATETSYKPQEFIDVETGDRITATTNKFFDTKRFRQVGADGNLVGGGEVVKGKAPLPVIVDTLGGASIRKLEPFQEVETYLYSWRWAVKALMLAAMDQVNALRITRSLQLSMPFLTAYEAYLLDQVIAVLEGGSTADLDYVLSICFKNRNVSRTLVQNLSRFDFMWHQNTQFKWNRYYDMAGTIPIIGWFVPLSFPSSENFPSTRNLVIASIFRRVLGKGLFWTRALTGREELLTDDQNVTAQNLAAESNGFETANRNQHGSYIGRQKTNDFRMEHRLPTDESVVRTFITTPLSTMINNGVEHVLADLGRHYHNMLYQPFGNFAHQRMEQLNPIEFLRFHFPVILVALTTLRGLSEWDASVMAPFVERLQLLKPVDTVEPVRRLVKDLQDHVVVNACGGVPTRIALLRSLLDAIDEALVLMEEEAQVVHGIVGTVHTGLSIGTKLLTDNKWKVPAESVLKAAIVDVCMGKTPRAVSAFAVRRALNLLAPKDKRTLIELVQKGWQFTRPAELLKTRTSVLLQRELRRDALDAMLVAMSKGEAVTSYVPKTSYWLMGEDGLASVYIYEGKKTGRDVHKFTHMQTRAEKLIENLDTVSGFEYVEVAEVVTRAQKAFMTIELDHGKKFVYDAFMEFSYLREPLRHLLVLSQVQCPELDDARLNVLQAIKSAAATTEVTVKDLVPGEKYYVYTNKQYEPFMCTKPYDANDPEFADLKLKKIVTVPPQNLIVVGGGPTGLVTTLHCTENVIASDGIMRLYESRDAFTQAGATFERAQIVRLDARWIAMLRYHLGTIFEDVWIPASGETDPHYGNTLPSQGFIEITIKDMESAMNVGVAKMASRGLMQQVTDSGAQYSIEKNSLVKLGKSLKVDDLVLRKVDPSGRVSSKDYSWRVAELQYNSGMPASMLTLGMEYAVYYSAKRQNFPYRLVSVNASNGQHIFLALDPRTEDITCTADNLPSVYPLGTSTHGACKAIVLEAVIRGNEGYAREELDFAQVAKAPFIVDIGLCHVCEAIGKPHGSSVHFAACTYEPYGVCCLGGLKVSMGMHQFGTRRWQQGLVDDIRSHTDQNTRVIGDFTKIVNSTFICEKMSEFLITDVNWRLHWEKLIRDLGVAEWLGDIWKLLCAHVLILKNQAPYRRSHLQTRFFETGDNFYLGMEFTREYDYWKNSTVETLVQPVLQAQAKLPMDDKKAQAAAAKTIKALRGTLLHHIDRLWYDACLETIRLGDVYNPGGQSKVPRLYLIDSNIVTTLGSLGVGESFRLESDTTNRYDVLASSDFVVVRDVEGYVQKLPYSTRVYLGGNLTRAPDGNVESKVSIATFPVSHYVNHRTVRLNNSEKGYIFAFLGDEQSTPHFMRYSGLTGACVNSMLINNFIGDAIIGETFIDRFRRLSAETNWSNGEVVQRGTGANYGEDGFLRPGFPLLEGMRYLHSKAIEYRETDQDVDNILSRDWKIKFAAAMVPRGLEHNEMFLTALREQQNKCNFDVFVMEAVKDPMLGIPDVKAALTARKAEMPMMGMEADMWWDDFCSGMMISDVSKARLMDPHVFTVKKLNKMLDSVVEYTQGAFHRNERISSQLENQPKSVDSFIDEYAVEAQLFANSLTNVTAFASIGIALQSGTMASSSGGSAALSAVSPILATGTITNTSRYKNRNEDWRVNFADKRYVLVLKAIYEEMAKADRLALPLESNPYYVLLEAHKDRIVEQVTYYQDPNVDIGPDPKASGFLESYAEFAADMFNPEAIKKFMKELLTVYIVDVWQVNSYIQQDLTNMWSTCEAMLALEESTIEVQPEIAIKARVLFERWLLFKPRLETSLQRGSILHGYAKQRSIKHTHICTLFMYVWNHVWWTRTNSSGCCALPKTISEARTAAGGCMKPVAAETKEIVAQMKDLGFHLGAPGLRREILDVEALYNATVESYVCSFIILSAALSFWTGICFVIAQIGVTVNIDNDGIRCLLEVTQISTAVNQPIIALLSVYHLMTQVMHLVSVHFKLSYAVDKAKDANAQRALRHIGWVAFSQEVVIIIRILSSLAAAVSIPWNFGSARVGDSVSRDHSVYLAIGAASAHAIALLLRFIVEYSLLYNLDSKLGEYVCDAFQPEIMADMKFLTMEKPSTIPPLVHERSTWEYVARKFLHKYRFDVVFRANRFGTVFQYIQAGLRPEAPLDLKPYQPSHAQTFGGTNPMTTGNVGIAAGDVPEDDGEIVFVQTDSAKTAPKISTKQAAAGALAVGDAFISGSTAIGRAFRDAAGGTAAGTIATATTFQKRIAAQAKLNRLLNTEVSLTPARSSAAL